MRAGENRSQRGWITLMKNAKSCVKKDTLCFCGGEGETIDATYGRHSQYEGSRAAQMTVVILPTHLAEINETKSGIRRRFTAIWCPELTAAHQRRSL